MNKFDDSYLPPIDERDDSLCWRTLFPMHDAARDGDVARVRQLVEAGVSVDSCDGQGHSPLHVAAFFGEHEVVELLINSKCDLNLKDICGRTPVMLATHLMYGVYRGLVRDFLDKRKGIVGLLLHRGAQVNCADDVGWTLLHLAEDDADIVRMILNTGEADLDSSYTECGYTPLMRAAFYGYRDIAALLVRAGADVNRSNRKKRTALHEAASRGSTRIVQILLRKEGLHLSPQDDMGDTPLHVACRKGKQKTIKLLLEAGADTNVKNNNGRSALSEGIEKYVPAIGIQEIKLFVQKGAFLENYDSVHIFGFARILTDVEFCTQSIVNKFHHQSLPALNSITYFASRLPHVVNFRLNAGQIDEVRNLVKCEIERNTFCNVVKVHPKSLGALCVLSLITCQSGKKRAASSDFGHSSSKKSFN